MFCLAEHTNCKNSGTFICRQLYRRSAVARLALGGVLANKICFIGTAHYGSKNGSIKKNCSKL